MRPLAALLAASSLAGLVQLGAAQAIAAIYDGGLGGSNGTAEPALRIANGGAGQSGLVKELADAFIQQTVANGTRPPFTIGWVTSDTTFSIQYLGTGDADVAITYSAIAEGLAIKKGLAREPSYYIFRDHFLLVGPPSNPANLTVPAEGSNYSSEEDTVDIFDKLFQAANAVNKTTPPTRFLSRYDKSATNIKDSQLWIAIGQVPWATPYSTWYHQYIDFPLGSLTAAILLGEYTLTDRGTYLSLDAALQNQTVIYKAGQDDECDTLLNPAHLLIGEQARDLELAYMFANWTTSASGQEVITAFTKGGQQLYTGAPPPSAANSTASCSTSP